jgi:hypothetical protein
MEKPLLRDPVIPPSKDVLENILGDSYAAFEELIKIITESPYALDPQWNYYKDGKAWLCKVCYKKKTVFWLSVWDQYFKTGFFFTDKTKSGIEDLDIDKEIIEDFKTRKPNGKFLPLAITMKSKDQIQDVLRVIEYKKSLK